MKTTRVVRAVLNWRKYVTMAMTIEKVLISDFVDASCRQILEAGGISVDYKTGLSKPELLAIVKVNGGHPLADIHNHTPCDIGVA